MNAFLISGIIFFLFAGTIVILATKLSTTIKERNYYQDEMNKAQNQLSKANFELKIKSEDRREADEKVNALHDGDSVALAIAGLSKHKAD